MIDKGTQNQQQETREEKPENCLAIGLAIYGIEESFIPEDRKCRPQEDEAKSCMNCPYGKEGLSDPGFHGQLVQMCL
jgi:hypothetical protein